MIANIIRNAKKYSTTGDPYYSAVSLMLSMDGTNGSTTFTDSSLNALTVTAVGNAQISTTLSKYGGASAYFDGSGDAVQIPYSAALDLTSGDFTIEGWVYFNSVSGKPTIITPFGTGNTFGGWVIVLNSSSQFAFYLSTAANTWNGPSNVLFSATAAATGTWYHFALVRNGSTFTPYLNGIAGTTATFSSTLYNNSKPLKIGAEKDSNDFPLNGYIDDLRISRFARYVSNFTPPTAALPTTASSTVADPYYNYTSLLLHMDGADTSTNFVDSGPNALAVTAAGNAKISTTQSKYGGASGYFDGSGDYLDIPYGEPFNLTTDYTVEFWMRPDSVTGYAPIFTLTSATVSYFGGIYVVRNGSTITFETRPADGSGSAIAAITGGSISVNTWYHVAASVSSNAAKLFINGVQVGSTTTFASRTFTPTGARVGRFANNYTSGLVDFQGYIDDLRITKYARYTSAFTPPAAALPDIYNPNTTLPVTGAALWLDASQQNTLFTDAGTTPVTTSGQSIYQWNDLSGNNRHAIQATSGNRPTWNPPASGQNGLGAVAFNGSQWLGFTNTFTNFTIFVVYKNTDTTNGSVLVGKSSGTSNYLFASTVSRIEMNGGGTQQANSTRTNGTQWDYSTFKYDGSTVTAYSSGTSGTSNNVGTTSFSPDRIGYYATASYALEGSISEFIVYPTALSDSDRTYVVNYIKSKWNL